MQITLRKIGNSQGIVIPKAVLAQLKMESYVEMTIENDCLVLKRATEAVRAGWADAARTIAAHKDDALVMGEFGNAGDDDLTW
jgi:antitoxin MazE